MTESLSNKLTRQEIACMRGVAGYKRTAQIAADVNLSEKTVDAYIASAAKKLGVSDRNTAIRMLIEDDPIFWGKSPSEITRVSADPTPVQSNWLSRLPWPVPTRWRLNNDLTEVETVVAIIVAASLMLAIAALYLVAIRMLGEQFFRH